MKSQRRNAAVVLTPKETEKRQQQNGPALYYALRQLVKAWEDPGPMGQLYQVSRAVSYAKSVLGKVETQP